jgi:hypothetical protein
MALFNQAYYRVHAIGPVIHTNYATWGWALLIIGPALAFAGYGIMVGRT